MAVTDVNLAETLGILGCRITHGGVDLGVITGFTIAPTTDPYQFKSARHGKLVTVKEIVRETGLAGTFSTSNILDDDITDIFAGGDGGDMIFEASEGAMVVTRENAETGAKQQVINVPTAAVRGTGFEGEAGTDEAKYNFAWTAFADASNSFGTITNSTPTP